MLKNIDYGHHAKFDHNKPQWLNKDLKDTGMTQGNSSIKSISGRGNKRIKKKKEEEEGPI